jgi:hypothetical protein
MPLLYILTLIIGVQFATTHALAEYFSLYWRYPWLDIPMHILGGIFLMMIYSSLHSMYGARHKVVPQWWVLVVFTAALLAWELFGIYRFGGLKPDFWTDSSLDLLCGAGGLILGYYLVRVLRTL